MTARRKVARVPRRSASRPAEQPMAHASATATDAGDGARNYGDMTAELFGFPVGIEVTVVGDRAGIGLSTVLAPMTEKLEKFVSEELRTLTMAERAADDVAVGLRYRGSGSQ